MSRKLQIIFFCSKTGIEWNPMIQQKIEYFRMNFFNRSFFVTLQTESARYIFFSFFKQKKNF